MNKGREKIMNKFKQIFIGGLFSLMACNTVAGVILPPVTGTLEMTGAAYLIDAGGYTTSDASLAVAIDFNLFGADKFLVSTKSGDFTSIVSNKGDIKDFQFDSFAGSIADFWTIDYFSFELTDVLADSSDSSFLTLKGSGIISAMGFEDTVASWHFSANTSGGGIFSWSATSITGVPEPGILALLSFGLIAIGLRRKI
jgi:hypothetical protein